MLHSRVPCNTMHSVMELDEDTKLSATTAREAQNSDARLQSGAAEIISAIERLEKVAREIRGLLDARQREDWRKDLTVWRVIAIVLEIIVVGLIVLALFDGLLQAPLGAAILKLAFAMALQLVALTAFLAPREK